GVDNAEGRDRRIAAGEGRVRIIPNQAPIEHARRDCSTLTMHPSALWERPWRLARRKNIAATAAPHQPRRAGFGSCCPALPRPSSPASGGGVSVPCGRRLEDWLRNLLAAWLRALRCSGGGAGHLTNTENALF